MEPQLYAVIPCYWVYDPNDALWDEFVNTGLNSSQKYVSEAQYSEDDSAEYLGAPNENFEPNFAAPRELQFPCTEGTYLCRIVKFKGIFIFLTYFLQFLLVMSIMFFSS